MTDAHQLMMSLHARYCELGLIGEMLTSEHNQNTYERLNMALFKPGTMLMVKTENGQPVSVNTFERT